MPNAATKRVKCEEAILKVPCLLQPSSCQLPWYHHKQVRHALEPQALGVSILSNVWCASGWP